VSTIYTYLSSNCSSYLSFWMLIRFCIISLCFAASLCGDLDLDLLNDFPRFITNDDERDLETLDGENDLFRLRSLESLRLLDRYLV